MVNKINPSQSNDKILPSTEFDIEVPGLSQDVSPANAPTGRSTPAAQMTNPSGLSGFYHVDQHKALEELQVSVKDKLSKDVKEFFSQAEEFVEQNKAFLNEPTLVVEEGMKSIDEFLAGKPKLPEEGVMKVDTGDADNPGGIIEALRKLGEKNGQKWITKSKPNWRLMGTQINLNEVGFGTKKGVPRFYPGGGKYSPVGLKNNFTTYDHIGQKAVEKLLDEQTGSKRIVEFEKTGIIVFDVSKDEIGVGNYNGQKYYFGQGRYVATKEFDFKGTANFESPQHVVKEMRKTENEHEGHGRVQQKQIEMGRYERVDGVEVVRASLGCPAIIQQPDGTAKAVKGLYITSQGEKAQSEEKEYRRSADRNSGTFKVDEVKFSDTQYYSQTLQYEGLDNNRGFTVDAQVSVDVAVIDPVKWANNSGGKNQPIDQIDETLRSTLIQHIGTLGEEGCKYIQQDFSKYENFLRTDLNKHHGEQYGYFIRKLDLKSFDIPKHNEKNAAQADAAIARDLVKAKAINLTEAMRGSQMEEEKEARVLEFAELKNQREYAAKEKTDQAQQQKEMKKLEYDKEQAIINAEIARETAKGQALAAVEEKLKEHEGQMEIARKEANHQVDLSKLSLQKADIDNDQELRKTQMKLKADVLLAEQQLDIEKVNLEKAKLEKQNKLLEAQAKAESIEIEAKAVRENKDEIMLKHQQEMELKGLEAYAKAQIALAQALGSNPNVALTDRTTWEQFMNISKGYPTNGRAVFAPYHPPHLNTMLNPPIEENKQAS